MGACDVRQDDGDQDRRQHDDRVLNRQSLDGRVAALLLDGAVHAEGESQCDGYPWEAAIPERERAYPDGAEADCDTLEQREPLLEDDDAENDGHQRVEVVADGRLHHAVDLDGVDVDAPVHGDEDGRGDEEAPRALPPEQPDEVVAHGHAEAHREHAAPDYPLADYLDGVDRREQLPVERENSPEDIAAYAGDDAGPALAMRGGFAHALVFRYSMIASLPWMSSSPT